MTAPIKKIDATSIDLISSGQVIVNLATAVKELLENSLDAGASLVQVRVEEHGSKSIEVIDNGCGVDEGDFQALTLKNHTSKIEKYSDLDSVKTFGFRGEALSSLCALSDVTITTRHRNASIGTTLTFDINGVIKSRQKVLSQVGTTVKLENLFSNYPIRRSEFEKHLKREYNKMCNVLYAYGLQTEGVRILCTNHVMKSTASSQNSDELQESCGKKKRLINLQIMDTRGESIEDNIASVFGPKQKQNLLRITEKLPSEETLSGFNLETKNLDVSKFKLNGFISSCAHGCGRATYDRQFYYINSRPVDVAKISRLVNETYHQYNKRQVPFVCLNITVAPGFYDVNVTPDKRQVMIQNENLLLAVLKESLNTVFKKIPATMEVQKLNVSSIFPMFQQTGKPPGQETKKKELFQSRLEGLRKFRVVAEKSKTNSRTETAILTPLRENENVLDLKRGKKLESPPEREDKFEDYSKPGTSRTPVVIVEQATNDKRLTGSETIPSRKHLEFFLKKPQRVPSLRPFSDDEESNDKDEAKEVDEHEDYETEKKELAELSCKTFPSTSASEGDVGVKVWDEGLSEKQKQLRKKITLRCSLEDIKEGWKRQVEEEKLRKEEKEKAKAKFCFHGGRILNKVAEKEWKRELSKESFAEMEVVGQFNLGFIITKLGSDIYAIDQHASDEKYNYETLKATTVIQTQKMVNPQKLIMPIDKEELMLQNAEFFRKNGFHFIFDKDAPPTRRVSLTSVPMSKNIVFGKDDLDELLCRLEDSSELRFFRPTSVEKMFASRACRMSVMIGTPLSRREMKRIVKHMGEIENPWNCPHGRPSIRHIFDLRQYDALF